MPRSTRSSWGSNKPARRKGYRTLRYWADEHDGRGYMRHTMTIEGSKRDGDRKLAELRLLHSEDGPVPTVRECYERWYLPDIESRLSKNSIAQYKSAWRSRICPRWGDAPVADVRPLEMQEWLLAMTRSQADCCVKVLSSVFEHAVRYEAIDRNPMRVKYRMPEGGMKRDKGVYDFGQSIAILKAARGSFIEPSVILSLFGSCRVGESLSATPDDVEGSTASNGMTGCTVRICRQINRDGGVESSMKTEQSERTVVLAGPPAERLLEIASDVKASGGMWLCDDGTGEPIGQRPAVREWRRIAESAGLPSYQFRNLRNSWRTYSEWELGIDPSKLEVLMGHKGKTVTERYYIRPCAQMLLDSIAGAYERAGFTELRDK